MPERSRGSAMDHERMLRMLADSVPQIICTAGPNGKIDYFNRRWFEFTGLGEAQTFENDGWPVSYTHLDVYKRQRPKRSTRRSRDPSSSTRQGSK